jgi:hypothetical protein
VLLWCCLALIRVGLVVSALFLLSVVILGFFPPVFLGDFGGGEDDVEATLDIRFLRLETDG